MSQASSSSSPSAAVSSGLNSSSRPVRVELYRWAGSWGPFEVKIPCGECALTLDILKDSFANELSSVPVSLEIYDWLDVWWRPLRRGGWHAPIVTVEGRLVSQGHALNRGVLTEAVISAHIGIEAVSGSHVFGKKGCPHCVRAKELLDEAGLRYEYHDVVTSPCALYEMVGRTKPIIGPRTPITAPQIWLDGAYIGGAAELATHLSAASGAASGKAG